MASLLDFLNLLDKDTQLALAFKHDPKSVLQTYGFNEQQQHALLSGDNQKIATLIGISSHELPAVDIPETPY